MATPVIEIKDLSKRFVIRKDKSLKERLVNATCTKTTSGPCKASTSRSSPEARSV